MVDSARFNGARAVARQIAYKADFDLNRDGLTNSTDLLLVAVQIGKSCR